MAIRVNNTTVIDDSRNATAEDLSITSLTYNNNAITVSANELNLLQGTTDSVQNQIDSSASILGSLNKTFTTNETSTINLSSSVLSPIVSVTKEVPQDGVTNNDWDVASDGANYTLHDTAYDTTLTPGEIGYKLSNGTYNDKFFDVSAQSSNPESVFFKPDGAQMYVASQSPDESIYQYSLSTAWDVTTASFSSEFSVASQASNAPRGVFIRDDGTKMYVVDNTTTEIYQYTLSTAWDILTASYDNVFFDVSGQDSGGMSGLYFKPDGTKLFTSGFDTSIIYEYSLSTPWDISTLSYSSVSLSVVPQEPEVQSVFVKDDGFSFYISGFENNTIFEYNMTSAWDLSTASYSGNFFYADTIVGSLTGQSGRAMGVHIGDDGKNAYIVSGDDGGIYQFSISSEGLVLGTGSFASTDVGKRIVGNGGEAILTAADGSFEEQTAFNDSSTIAAGDWSMFALDVESADAGLTLNGLTKNTFYDLTNAVYDNKALSVSGQDNEPSGIFFSPDGLKFYMLGEASNTIYQYSLSTAFDISTASYDSISFSVGSQDGNPRSISLSNDGLKLYMTGFSSDRVHQYSLSTAFDIGTASEDGITLNVSSQDLTPTGMTFNADGSKLYVGGQDNNDVFQYNLSTPFALNTANYSNVSFSVSSETTQTTGVAFSSDGLKMFISSSFPYGVFEYSLTSSFDVSTASHNGVFFDTSGQTAASVLSVVFDATGSKMYIADVGNSAVYQYSTRSVNNFFPTSTTHTAITSSSTNTKFWTDINSMTVDDASYDGSIFYAVSTDDRTTWSIIDDTEGVRDIVRNNAGTWEYNDASNYGSETWVAATENDEFYALEEAVDVPPRPVSLENVVYDNVSFNIQSEDDGSQGIAFKDDGTKLYMVGRNTDAIYQYSLSTAWDVGTASYDNVSISVSSEDTQPNGIFFKPDGTRIYMTGETNDNVYQYSLSTAWDLSTASYDSVAFPVGSVTGEGAPSGIYIRSDGIKMYISGFIDDAIYQFTLSSAWDLSTASYDNVSFSVDSEDGTAYGMTLKSDGTKMYMVGNVTDSVYQYSLSTAWDLSTASYDNVSFSVASEDTQPTGIFLKPDGTKMYIVGNDNDVVAQYSFVGEGSPLSLNLMDADQLNAVSDANHYTLGDDLDLAITLTMPDGSTSSPTSDGVSINYDGNLLNRGAILGTDYNYVHTSSTSTQIESLSDENLKITII